MKRPHEIRESVNLFEKLLSKIIANIPAQARVYLQPLFLGVLLAIARRQTVTKWICAALLSEKYRKVFYHIPYLGRKSTPIFDALDEIILEMLFANIDNNTKIQFVIDDTLIKRYGILVEGAGHHHNPTRAKPMPNCVTVIRGLLRRLS
ncbi:MAG: hypothetical protein LBQ50_05550 [Planctomycetaceae bacterium]|jgi:hypothetical protein|nr:hypothetical protein [Planctomycetaceae bacterium]